MTPEQLKRLEKVESLLSQMISSDRYIFERTLQLSDGGNIQVGRTTGTTIATSPTQKIAFWGVTPVTQQVAPATVSIFGSDTDHDARVAIAALRLALVNVGIIV